jgi:hypothetical protein
MALHLTSCERVRDPGFSWNEILDLLHKIENSPRSTITIECSREDCCGEIRISGNLLTVNDRHVIAAALGAYARG